MRLFPILAVLCGLSVPSLAQQSEIFIPGATPGAAVAVPGSALAACLLNPSAVACAGAVLDPTAPRTESTLAAPEPAFEVLKFDPDANKVAVTTEPPVAPPDYSGTLSMQDIVALPSVAVTIEFDFDSATIRGHQVGKIVTLAGALRDPALQGASFAVIGHTDAAGSTAYNCDLSNRRAIEVARALQLKLLEERWDGPYSAFLLLTYCVFPAVSQTIFQVFSCDEPAWKPFVDARRSLRFRRLGL